MNLYHQKKLIFILYSKFFYIYISKNLFKIIIIIKHNKLKLKFQKVNKFLVIITTILITMETKIINRIIKKRK